MPLLGDFPGYCRATGLVRSTDADWADVLALTALGAAPLFLLTVRSWTNGCLIALCLLALYDIARRPQTYRPVLADMRIRWTLAALVGGFFAILISQALRGTIEPKAYDGPLRLLIAAPVLLHLTARRIEFTRLFAWVCPLAVLATALLLAINQKPFDLWYGRWATYFVDPLTLGQYSLLLGFFSLMGIDLNGRDPAWARMLKLLGFVTGVAISIGAESRSAWLAAPALLALWVILGLGVRSRSRIALGLLAVIAICVLVYIFSFNVQHRLDDAFTDLRLYFDGSNRNTSIGMRISLWRAAWELFLASPWHGYGDANLPPLAQFPAIAPYNSEQLEFTIAHNGTHNELLQNMIRSGVFGLVSTLLILVVPFVIYVRALRSEGGAGYAAASLGLCYIVALICFSFATEVLTLKYLASFYGVMIAAATAQLVWGGAPAVAPVPTAAPAGGPLP